MEMTVTYDGEHDTEKDGKIIEFISNEFGLKLRATGYDLRESIRNLNFDDKVL